MREEKSTYVQEAWLRVFLKDKLIVLIPEFDEETRELENWRAGHETHALLRHHKTGRHWSAQSSLRGIRDGSGSSRSLDSRLP